MARKPKQVEVEPENLELDEGNTEREDFAEDEGLEDMTEEDTEQELQDLSKVEDISVGNADFNENTVFLVLKTFTIIIGNGAVEGEVGKKIKISKADDGVIKTLLSKGYIKVVG